MCKFPTSFTLVTFAANRTPSVCEENLILPGMERIFYLYILQLVLQVSPLSLEHVCLVQSILQSLGQTEYVALLEVHLLLQLPLL